MKLRLLHRSDLIGILASLACMVHCMLPPVLLGMTAVAGHAGHSWLHHLLDEEYHHYMDWAFVLLAGLSVYYSLKSPTSRWVKWGLVVSFVGFGVFVLLHEFWHESLYISITFSLALVVFHGIKVSQAFTGKKEGVACSR